MLESLDASEEGDTETLASKILIFADQIALPFEIPFERLQVKKESFRTVM